MKLFNNLIFKINKGNFYSIMTDNKYTQMLKNLNLAE